MANITLEPNKDYQVTFTGNELAYISNDIMELPAKIANPLLAKLEAQFKDKDEAPKES